MHTSTPSEEECGLRLHRRGLGPEGPGGVASELGLERKVGPGNCRRHPSRPQQEQVTEMRKQRATWAMCSENCKNSRL